MSQNVLIQEYNIYLLLFCSQSAMVRGDENTHSVFKSKIVSHQSLVIYEDPRGVAPTKHDVEIQTDCTAMHSIESQTDCTGCYSCSEKSTAVYAESSHSSLLDVKLLTQGLFEIKV